MSDESDRVNMASEYYVMSMLYRKGLTPNLTLGNKKAIDIVLLKNSKYLTIDVKGSTGKNDPFVNKVNVADNHFYIFVLYEKYFDDPYSLPSIYIVPSNDLESLVKNNERGKNIKVARYSKLVKQGQKYKDNWDVLLKYIPVGYSECFIS